MSSTAINHAGTYFDHLTLTKIRGIPCFIGLQCLKNQIKANLVSINTDLEGGNNGNLVLVLTTTGYISVVVVAYAAPVYPGPVTLVGAIHHEIIRLRNDYNRYIRFLLRSNWRQQGYDKVERSSHQRNLPKGIEPSVSQIKFMIQTNYPFIQYRFHMWFFFI